MRRPGVLAFAVVASQVGCAGAVVPPARAEARPGLRTLETIPADPASSSSYRVAIEPCAQGKCPVAVQLVRKGRPVDSLRLDWESSGQEVSPEDVDPRWGAGDPMETAPPLRAWATGSEAGYLSILARPVRLTAERFGLLVTERAGWEHLKHRHDLFVEDGDRLRRVWSGTEGAGPTWSSTDVVPAAGGAEQVLFLSGFLYPTDERTDWLVLKRVAWDGARGEAVESAAAGAIALELVAFGPFDDVGAGRSARDGVDGCLAPQLWVLDGAAYHGVDGRIFLGAVTARREHATRLLEAARRCPHPLNGKVLPYRESK